MFFNTKLPNFAGNATDALILSCNRVASLGRGDAPAAVPLSSLGSQTSCQLDRRMCFKQRLWVLDKNAARRIEGEILPPRAV